MPHPLTSTTAKPESDHVLTGAANAREAFEQLGPGLRAIWATQVLDDQVRNGGFAQFFWNPSGRYAPDAHEGLVRIGAPQRHAIIQQAMDRFIPALPEFRALREKADHAAFGAFAERIDFSALDSAYYKLDKVENLGALQIAYIRSHADEFTIG